MEFPAIKEEEKVGHLICKKRNRIFFPEKFVNIFPYITSTFNLRRIKMLQHMHIYYYYHKEKHICSNKSWKRIVFHNETFKGFVGILVNTSRLAYQLISDPSWHL